MTENSRVAYAPEGACATDASGPVRRWFDWKHLLLIPVLAALFYDSAWEMYLVWMMDDSYYSHGFLVPIISLGIAWAKRRELSAAPRDQSIWGVLWLVAGLFMIIVGDFLGFRVFVQIAIVPVLTGLIIALYGKTSARILWFPLVFLLFMVPIPVSITTPITFKLKMVAAKLAVYLAQLITLPMVREGSYIHFGTDKLLIGDVCGGLRSLISLLAVGALATYFSRTRTWARAVLLGMTVPIAIVANVVRIFILCVVGYFWGSEFAAGRFHDISGVVIFVVAFILFFALEAYLRRVAPLGEQATDAAARPRVYHPAYSPVRAWSLFIVALVLVVSTTGAHAAILKSQRTSQGPKEAELAIPSQIGPFKQRGSDLPIPEYVYNKLETSSILIRPYLSKDGWPVDLTIVYAGRTRRSLHFPEVCLTGAGWDILKQEPHPVSFLFEAKKLVLVKGDHRQAVLYWFKTGERFTGNYFLNAFYWAKNQVTFGKSTSAMIKVSAPIPVGPGGEEAAFSVLDEFAMKLSPVLRNSVP